MSKYNKWTKKELCQLYKLAGSHSLEYISKELNRTPSAIKRKMHNNKLKLLQGTYTLADVIRKLGCTYYTVHRLIKKLKIEVTRSLNANNGHILITDNQFKKIVDAYIPPAGWSREHSHCLACSRTDRKHQAFGLCKVCYDRSLLYNNTKESCFTRIKALYNQSLDMIDNDCLVSFNLSMDKKDSVSCKLQGLHFTISVTIPLN